MGDAARRHRGGAQDDHRGDVATFEVFTAQERLLPALRCALTAPVIRGLGVSVEYGW